MTSSYDSVPDTQSHIDRVQGLIFEAVHNLKHRAAMHDQSKLVDPEKSVFDEVTPQLRELEYGSDAYKASLANMGAALRHHYDHNSHHPEHYENGMAGMSLFDVVEMLLDWKAASERHATGDIYKSIEQNAERFGYPPMLQSIFVNTAKEMGW